MANNYLNTTIALGDWAAKEFHRGTPQAAIEETLDAQRKSLNDFRVAYTTRLSGVASATENVAQIDEALDELGWVYGAVELMFGG